MKMLFIDRKVIFLLIIHLTQELVHAEYLKGYVYNKSANKYFKIQEPASSTTTTVRPRFTITSTTTESTRRIDELKKVSQSAQSTIQQHNSPVQTIGQSTTTVHTADIQLSDSNHHPISNQNNNVATSVASANNRTSIKPSNVQSTNSDQSELELERPKINMLDFISGVSKAINLLLYQREPMRGGLESQESAIKEENQTATTTTQSISIFRPLKVNSKIPPEGLPADYRAQGELLRQQILRRCSQLQNIIATTNEILRERENYMFVKILDNFSSRIEHTKLRADLILKEPSTSVTAVKALNRINYGLNNMNNLVQKVLSRVNVSINLDMKENQKESNKESRRESKRMKEHNKSNRKEIKKETEKVQ